MNRSLAIAGAFALAAALPTVTLGAPTERPAPSRPAAAAPHGAVRDGSLKQGDFTVPFQVHVQPGSLAAPHHFAPASAAAFTTLALASPYRWYPTLSGPACAAASLWGSPGAQQPSDFTLGSLVDGKANLLSSPSSSARSAVLPALNGQQTASSSALTFQAVAYPTPCGPQSFTSF